MSINVGSRIVAETRCLGVYGIPAAGAYGLRLSIEFKVLNWTEGTTYPLVTVTPATVYIAGHKTLLLGYAAPETTQPFTVGRHASTRAALYEFIVSPQAMAAVEEMRNGQGIVLNVKLHAQVSVGPDTSAVQDELTCRVNQSDWLVALEQCGFGRTLLFEIPIPPATTDEQSSLQLLDGARRHLLKGHYPETVAACRLVLESLTAELGQGAALKAAIDVQKNNHKAATVDQRELYLRQAAAYHAHLAHHIDGAPPDSLYDRTAAQMLLGVTASLVCSAMERHVAGVRQP